MTDGVLAHVERVKATMRQMDARTRKVAISAGFLDPRFAEWEATDDSNKTTEEQGQMDDLITVSYSEIDTWRQCPFKWRLAYRERWVLPPDPNSALAKGSLWHLILEEHYRAVQRGAKSSEVAMAVNKIFAEAGQQDGYEETVELIRWMYDGYVAQWANDSDWDIVAVEYANEFNLPIPDGTASPYKVKMKIDLVVKSRETGKLWIVDHKSGRDLPTERMLELDDQFGLYTWGLRLLGKKVHGALYNSARTLRYKDPSKPQPLTERFKRTLMYRTDVELNTVAVEAGRSANRAWTTPHGEEERTPDTDRCRWRCNFTEACLDSRKGYDLIDALESRGFERDRERH